MSGATRRSPGGADTVGPWVGSQDRECEWAGPALEGGPDAGLDAAQVLAARRRYGSNEVVPEASRRWIDVVRDSARDPMLWFLLAAAALFGLLGQATEAVVLLAALLPLAGMDVYLHRRTVASTASLASRLAARARVLRDGAWADLPSAELVPGDLVEIGAGSYFPADGLLIAGAGLQCDESSLTGEALPVAKRPLSASEIRAARIPDRHWGTAGTRLLTGTARMRVVRTGARTRYGELARATLEGPHEGTPLQRAIGELVARILVAALALCLLLGAVRVTQGHGWADAVLSAMTLAVAALPEEFPVVYAFFLGLGAFRLARRKALVRRAVAVENIGRISCILSDKTGTLTAGVLTLTHRLPAPGVDDAALLRCARRAAREESGDPLDQALLSTAAPSETGVRLAVFPFTEHRRRETSIWQEPPAGAGAVAACTKGAPETILAPCDLPPAEREAWRERVRELAAGGRKVIACAERALASDANLQEPGGDFMFVGLLAFADPPRPGVAEAMRDCAAMGIRILMVTGDHPATAQAIATEIGLGGGRPEVAALDTAQDAGEVLRRRPGLHVVARAAPAQKLQLVQALRECGELVAVTGDGVNDVPALREADVGVAMGERGTRAAREAAAIVLVDDNFRHPRRRDRGPATLRPTAGGIRLPAAGAHAACAWRGPGPASGPAAAVPADPHRVAGTGDPSDGPARFPGTARGTGNAAAGAALLPACGLGHHHRRGDLHQRGRDPWICPCSGSRPGCSSRPRDGPGDPAVEQFRHDARVGGCAEPGRVRDSCGIGGSARRFHSVADHQPVAALHASASRRLGHRPDGRFDRRTRREASRAAPRAGRPQARYRREPFRNGLIPGRSMRTGDGDAVSPYADHAPR